MPGRRGSLRLSVRKFPFLEFSPSRIGLALVLTPAVVLPMATLAEVNQRIQDYYKEKWSVLFGKHTGLVPATVNVMLADGAQGYSKSRNLIEIRLGEGNLEEEPSGLYPNQPLSWEICLMHEVVHEYEDKILNFATSDAGDRLLAETPAAKRFDSTHGPSFYAAVAEVAVLLKKSPSALLAVL